MTETDLEFNHVEEEHDVNLLDLSSSKKRLIVRLDKWLWAARFFKTRALARAAVEKYPLVTYNSHNVSPTQEVEVGAVLKIRSGTVFKLIRVTGLSTRRRSTDEAGGLYELIAELPVQPQNPTNYKRPSYNQSHQTHIPDGNRQFNRHPNNTPSAPYINHKSGNSKPNYYNQNNNSTGYRNPYQPPQPRNPYKKSRDFNRPYDSMPNYEPSYQKPVAQPALKPTTIIKPKVRHYLRRSYENRTNPQPETSNEPIVVQIEN